MRILRLVLLSVLVMSACAVAAEFGRRILDGYQLWSLGLVANPSSVDLTWSDGRSTEALLRTVKLDLEADRSWFYDRPQPLQGTSPEWVDQRRREVDAAANYVFNAAALKDPGIQAYLQTNQARLKDIFTFHAPNGDPYPTYRLYPGIQTGFGVTNEFGWRSRPIAPVKAANVIRIGVLGDSTTNAYPGLLEHWLNRWSADRHLGITFEVINAARPASGALDAAAIVDLEFGTVGPDYVIVYGFGNGVYGADALIKLPPGIVKGQPSSAAAAGGPGNVPALAAHLGAKLEPLTRWSAAATFLRHRLLGQRGGTLSPEPPKPATRMEFPPEIDESSPDPAQIARHAGGGLMGLETYLQGLDKMNAVAKARNIRLFVSTFRIMAFDGMLLGKGDPDNGGIIYSVVNEQYWWPYTYAQIRRLSSFYNRTLRAWAQAHGHETISIDEQMPWRPELYGDGLHELPTGEALHAWIALQELMPRIRADQAQQPFVPTAARAMRPDDDRFWKIEPMSVVAALNAATPSPPATVAPVVESPAANPTGTPTSPADEVIGAFPLSKIASAYAKAEVVPGGVPLITTALEASAYAAVIPLQVSAGSAAGRGSIEVRVRVSEGGISVGVLSKSADRFVAQATVKQSPDIQEIHLLIDDLSDIGSLMISNNRPGETARSVAALHGVVLRRFRR